MKTEYEINHENAEKLSRLILENPTLRVVAWIDSEGITDEYGRWAGNIECVEIQTIAYSESQDLYVSKDGDPWEDCCDYYGLCAEDWDDETLERKAKEIPWEDVIAINVSAG